MIGRFFAINGYNISSLIIGRFSLRFSRRTFESTTEFNDWWNKTLFQNGKLEINFDAIKSIVKEIDSDELSINYKIFDLLPNICKFSFEKNEDAEYFFDYLTEEKHFQKKIAPSSTFYATIGYVKGVIITALFTTIFFYLSSLVRNGGVKGADASSEAFFSSNKRYWS